MNKFDEVQLLGTRFHKLRVYELIDYIVKAAKQKNKVTVSNVNIRAINFACKLPWYQEFINKSNLVFCDGFGVLLGAKMCGCNLNSSHRMTCPDYIENLALACERNNVSLFILAGKPGIVDNAITKLKSVAPNLIVEGHHGYFNKYGKDNELVIQRINKFKPDILYVGFGMPIQENWIRQNIDAIEAKVFLPLGACLDFYTGSVYRGPRWMTESGFEWLTRFFTEPKRLWERYIVGNPLFFSRIFLQLLQKRFKKLTRVTSRY
ncbi:MAG: WecB/TagA/CpsF family glycosyltransferase [Cyanobacteria bacterium P01_A01_bin.68]